MPGPAAMRPIRSFVRREGRMTEGQRRAFERLWARFGLDLPPGRLDLPALFGRSAPVTLEIGFGNGDTLAEMAAAAPERDFLGIEVHRPGVGRLLHTLERRGVENVRVISEDAVIVLERHIPDAALDTLQLFFPDPWPKKRHHKRRIVQPPFVALIARKLRRGGTVHMATDWEGYAEQMRAVLEAEPTLENRFGPGRYAPRPAHRPLTKFEARGRRLGHGVWDLIYTRVERDGAQ